MFTSKAINKSSQLFPSIRRGSLGRLVSAAVLTGVFTTGCSHSWDEFDPRLAPGTGGSGGAVIPVKCGGTSALVSDFSGTGLTNLWEINMWGGANIAESNGELVYDLSSDGTQSAAYIHSEYYYDFRNDFASVEVLATPGVGKAAEAFLDVSLDEANYVEIYQKDDMLNFGYERTDTYNKIKSIPYDPVAHRFWQMRESDGVVIYETSPDGQTWTNQLEMPEAALFPLDLVRIYVGGIGDAGTMGPRQARFDKLSGGGPAKQKYCPMHSYTDDFNDGMEDRQWTRSWEDKPGMLLEEGGQFVVHYPPDVEAYAGLVSARAFDLTNSSLVLEVTAAPQTMVQGHLGIDLNGPGDNDVEMFIEEGFLKFGIENFGMFKELGGVAYAPLEHRWLRIREASNSLFWESAPDGKTWRTLLEVSPLPVPVDVLDVEIHGGTWTPQMNPGEARADNLNLPPP